MSKRDHRYVYGPVPSRRLGRSLGVDIVPFKTCTFDCIYCQLGRTTNKTVERREYFDVEDILVEVRERLSAGADPNYITIAGSGEPTLNSAIGILIPKIKEVTDVPVVVLTNGALLWRQDVQDDLMMSDIVIPSLDAGDEDMFLYINRPHPDARFEHLVDGIASFTERFRGKVWLEVMLLSGITGLPNESKKIADLARRIAPDRIQLNTAIRPSAEEFAFPMSDNQMSLIREMFPGNAEIVCNKEHGGHDYRKITEEEDRDILLMISRRPCTALDISDGLCFDIIELYKRLDGLTAAGKAKRILAGGQTFFSAVNPA